MTILITAASGQLGRLVVEALLARGVTPSGIRATARDVTKLTDLSERGVAVAELDYARPDTIAAALDGADTVLLISASEPGNRVPLHQNVIDEAAAAGVAKLVYTSAPSADTSTLVLVPDHRATEAAIAASGVPAVVLRNNWYTENYAADLARAAETGVLASSTGDGRIASASRADYAEAAAVALLEDGHVGQVYELGGDAAWDFSELADAMSAVLGRAVVYTPLTTDEHIAALQSAGLDAGTAAFVAAIDTGIRDGELAHTDGTLARLIGRPTTPLVEGLRALRTAH